MIILILILAIVAAFFLAGILSPVLILGNRKKLAAMSKIVDHYVHNRTAGFADPEAARAETRKRLIAIKRTMWIGDKKAAQEAQDLLDSV